MSKYKAFGATLLSFWIILFLLSIYVFYIYYMKLTNNSSNIMESIKSIFKTGKTSNNISTSISNRKIFSYLLGDEKMFMVFVILTFLSLIFSLVHCIYLFAERKANSYTKKDEKDILTITFVGYLFIFIAYLSLFIPIIFNLDIPFEFVSICYGLFMVIGVILISVGLSQAHEKDKKMKNLKSTSIVAPSLISITGIIYGIAPACCKLIDIQNDIKKNTLSEILKNTTEKQAIIEYNKKKSMEKLLNALSHQNISNL